MLCKPLTQRTILNTIRKDLRVSYIYHKLSKSDFDSHTIKCDSTKESDLPWQEQPRAMPKSRIVQLREAAYKLNEDLIIQIIN
ncbi:MAG: hypothetical protein QNJ68_15755 [Microcoleaceae cyanobacterium MO_207.B10]|nr:hypothetical protein [Microcoleaceae cyanobacterium MO_207.B10]